MNVKPGEKESVILLPSNVTMKQSLDMVLFTITYYDLVNAKDLEEGIRMTITLKRKIMSEMMTTYFPSFLLMMITYATTFFKPFFFEAALSVNLTTMLVMTTIFISKMESLPSTSATKMIDYWLILCQLVPFAQVVLLTAMEFLREEEQEENLAFEEQDSLDKDDIHPPTPPNHNTAITAEDETMPKEAWTIPQRDFSKVSSLTMLSIIGKVFIRFQMLKTMCLFREESVAPVCALCIHRVLCDCWKFLFVIICVRC